MKKLIIYLSVLSSGLLFSQEATETPVQNTNRWTFGGGIGFGFGSNNYFSLSAAPRVGYMLTNDLEGGILGSVSWQKSNAYSSTMFGLGPFLNYYIARTFFYKC